MSTTAISTSLANPEPNIRLRTLKKSPSVSSSTTTLPSNPFLSPLDTNTSPSSSTTSLTSTQNPILSHHSQSFTPTTILHIESQGKKALSLPFSSNEQEISIFSDGEEGGVRYKSIRPERRSGNSELFRLGIGGESGNGNKVAETKYRFGPGLPPKITILGDGEGEGGNDVKEDIILEGKNLVSRTVVFESQTWGPFEWRYAGRKERARYSDDASKGNRGQEHVPNNLLLLEKIIPRQTKKDEERILIARFVRSEEARTQGSRASAAGNGGRLEICISDEMEGDRMGCEALVVASCLCMLKKEIDRRRALQLMVIGAAASS